MPIMEHPSTIGLAVRQVYFQEVENDGMMEIVSNHYPEREIMSMPIDKISELYAVTQCISDLLRENNWHIQHEKSGAACLFEDSEKSVLTISISHTVEKMETGGVAYAAVILSRELERIGVDIVLKDDPRIKRVAHRVMREEEIETGRLAEIWACKEAMYKALGPLLDYKRDLKVEFNRENNDIIEGAGYNWKVYNEEKVVVVLGPF
jgi:phosphopantetheinyl transferase